MLAFIADLYSVIQDTNAREAAEAAHAHTHNGQGPAEAAQAAQTVAFVE